MAATTTAFTACDWKVELDDDGGSLQDISGSTNTLDANFDNDVGEFRVFGTEWKARIVCGKDASFKIKGIATTATNEIKDLIETWFFAGREARSFQFSSPGADSGDYVYAAEVVLKTFKFSGDAASADPVMYDIELVPTGAVTRTIIP